MSYYMPLGARPATAVADTTDLNTGNWTATLTPDVINVTVPVFEMYHMYIQAPTLNAGEQSNARVRWNQYFWDATLVAQLNSWDPSQPMLLIPGDEISVLFNVPISSTPAPMITCYFRYEP